MGTKQDHAGEVLEVTTGMLHAFLARAAELGVDVTAEQVATNLLPNFGQVAGEMVAYAKAHGGSLKGAELTVVAKKAEAGHDAGTAAARATR